MVFGSFQELFYLIEVEPHLQFCKQDWVVHLHNFEGYKKVVS